MSLSFPNQSRSFNETKRQVRFWGYDGVLEISFDVEAEALQKMEDLSPALAEGEARILEAFDNSLEKIQQVAARAYSRGRRGSYAFKLVVSDF